MLSIVVGRRYWLSLILVAGLLLRYVFRDYSTFDTFRWLLPWYAFARDHGVDNLNTAFTNYTPFYEYLLIIVTRFDGFAKPLLLIKTISFVFELAASVLAYQLVYSATRCAARSTVAFAVSWLAPTVIFNGAMWGQCDAIWSFFVLLAIFLYCRGQQGVLPFAVAFAVKAQGIFLAPFTLGMLLRRPGHWLWLTSIPVVYLMLALPRVLAGGSVWQVLGVYLNQSATFHRLSMNAANLWIFVPDASYSDGVLVGLVLAFVGGLAVAGIVAKSRRTNPEYILLAACTSLLLMPYLLPKMHDRYFYAFEVASLSLACINPRYAVVAVIAQVDGILAYLPFDRQWIVYFDSYSAALCNTVLVLFLLGQLFHNEEPPPFRPFHFVRYMILCVCFAIFLAFAGHRPINAATMILGTLFCLLLPVQAYLMLRRDGTTSSPGRQVVLYNERRPHESLGDLRARR